MNDRSQEFSSSKEERGGQLIGNEGGTDPQGSGIELALTGDK